MKSLVLYVCSTCFLFAATYAYGRDSADCPGEPGVCIEVVNDSNTNISISSNAIGRIASPGANAWLGPFLIHTPRPVAANAFSILPTTQSCIAWVKPGNTVDITFNSAKNTYVCTVA